VEEFLSRLVEIYDEETIESVVGPMSLYGGFLVGLIWGVVLQKGRLCDYNVVSGLFRLQDFTVWRLGTPLLMTSMVLLYFFKDMGVIELAIPKTVILPQILGGLLFGAGIAILGYCPGTAAGAIGEGMLDAIPAIIGMITGSVIYAEFFFERWQDNFLTIGDLGRVTFPDLLGVNHWYVIVPFILMGTLFLLSTTMFDWFLMLFGRMLNYFDDMTQGIEKQLSSTSETVSCYYNNALTAMKKLTGGSAAADDHE